MVNICCVCKEKNIKGNVYTFHTFPSDPQRRLLWEQNIRKRCKKVPKTARICSKHFKPTDYEQWVGKIRMLKKDAIPDGKIVSTGFAPYHRQTDSNQFVNGEYILPEILPQSATSQEVTVPAEETDSSSTDDSDSSTTENSDSDDSDSDSDDSTSSSSSCSSTSTDSETNTLSPFGLPRRADREPSKYSLICSCHFVDANRKNRPTIFERNKKNIYGIIPEGTKRIRKRTKISLPGESDEVATRINPKQFKSSTSTLPKTIILPSHSQLATQNATQGNSSHIEQLHIKDEPLQADPNDYRLYQQLRDSMKTEPDNSDTDSTHSDTEKHIHSNSTDKEHFVNVKKECSDNSENQISVNHETEQIPMFESVFVKAEPFEEDDLPS